MPRQFTAAGIMLAVFLGAQDVPTFITDTKLVVVNVAVRDKAGRLITNLAKEDFQIFEDGTPQKLAVFDVQELSTEPMAPLSFAPRPGTLEERAPLAPAPRDLRRFQDKRLIAFFFDLTSMQPADQLRARDGAIAFLEKHMTAADLVSIMTFSTKLTVAVEFTDDRETLIGALRGIALGEGSDLAVLAATDTGDDDNPFAGDAEFNMFNTDRKLTALEDAARKLAVYPEKKALIYFSGGVEKTGIENQSQLKTTVNAAVRANVAFYPVDARGLMASVPGGEASMASPRGTGILTGTRQASQRDSFNESQETLYSLAADTGGKALLDSNDLTEGIRRAQSDIRSYYTLGYYPTNAAEDGSYRRLRVQLARNSLTKDLKLDYRNGYYAAKTWKQFTAADKERQLEEALTLGDPVSELPLALEVDYFRVAKDRYFVPVSVKLPGSVIALARKGGKQTTDFDFIGEVRDARGHLAGGVRDQITVKLTDADAERLAQRHFQYDTGLTLAPGDYRLVFLAREDLSGKMGTFETKFTVPDLNNNTRTLRVSSVILSSQREAVAAAVGVADGKSEKKLLVNHPLVQDGQKIVPSITRVFRKDQTMYVYFEVYDPDVDADRKAPNLLAGVELMQGARKVFTSRPARVNRLSTPRPGVAVFQFQVPMARLQPGEYVAQVNAIDELGKKFAFPRSSIIVLP